MFKSTSKEINVFLGAQTIHIWTYDIPVANIYFIDFISYLKIKNKMGHKSVQDEFPFFENGINKLINMLHVYRCIYMQPL